MGINRSKTNTTNTPLNLTESTNPPVRKFDVGGECGEVASCTSVVRSTEETDGTRLSVSYNQREQYFQITPQPWNARPYSEWVDIFKACHGSKYTYTPSTIPNSIQVYCTVHDATYTVHRGNLKHHGTKCCREAAARLTHQTPIHKFIEKASSIHSNKYDYSQVEYINTHTKICVSCPSHGNFYPTPLNHLQGSGCRKCHNAITQHRTGGYTKRRFSNYPELKTKPAILYVIKMTGDEPFIKVGITEKTVENRFKFNSVLPYEYEVLGTIQGTLYGLFKLEQLAKKQLKSQKYQPLKKFNGHTECFEMAALEALLLKVGINTLI